jgi:uncharacterized membrane protein YhaH (DUF805 family)
MIGFGEAIRLFYTNYVNFEGRATRAEYWWPTLMQVIVYVVLFILLFAVVGTADLESDDDLGSGFVIILLIMILFALINFLPGIAVKVRRFHDLDQTGWLVLVFWAVNLFVPLVEFARMIWFAMPGTVGANQYGPDPQGYDTDIFG